MPAAVFDDVIRDPSGATEDFHLRIVATSRLTSETIEPVSFAAAAQGGRLAIQQDLSGEGRTVHYTYMRH